MDVVGKDIFIPFQKTLAGNETQTHQGFELWSPLPFPLKITVTLSMRPNNCLVWVVQSFPGCHTNAWPYIKLKQIAMSSNFTEWFHVLLVFPNEIFEILN